MKLNFDVREQRIYYNEIITPVADTSGYLNAVFKIEGIFKNQSVIVAIFLYGEDAYTRVCSKDGGKDGVWFCEVPDEVIKSPGFQVSLFSGKRLTTSTVQVKVDPSGYRDVLKESVPSQTAYEDILKRLAEISEQQIPEERLKKSIEEYMKENPYKPETLTNEDVDGIAKDAGVGGKENGGD